MRLIDGDDFYKRQAKRCNYSKPIIGTCVKDNVSLKSQLNNQPEIDLTKGYFGFTNKFVLAKCFEEWAKENNVSNCPQSVISWLNTMGFLYVDKANEYANQIKEILNNGG